MFNLVSMLQQLLMAQLCVLVHVTVCKGWGGWGTCHL